ncbi:hypothetical protein AB7849_14035 [Rhodanobacter sp. 115]|uniref:hypothetical protein n=1 Tax=Rhodanobacter sp. FW021-MT20 TaxID=1162282 RepID=UPI000260E3D6|nr:hypothetical protein [Rhodanobacter sp. 115]EIL90944.1 hypothetical protein UU5_14788 [Rhodanobacter sp. 115]
MSSTFERLDEILGVSFGDIVPEFEGVLVDVHIRANITFGGKEGTRGGLLLHTGVVRGLVAGLPEVIEAMRKDGADHDLLPPAALPVPAWNAGPRWNPGRSGVHLCMGFGVRAIAPEHGAAVMVIQSGSPEGTPGMPDVADYLMGWSVLLGFEEALPKVLRKLERVATPKWRRQ